MSVLGELWRWRRGRQGTGYDKLLLATGPWPVPFDLYLLRFPCGIEVPWHRDPVAAGKRHHRVNLVLWRADRGGDFQTRSAEGRIASWPRLEWFRPDVAEHAMTRIEAGHQLMLSLGWLA